MLRGPMDDLRKTRDRLLDEMEHLRRELANLEVEMFDGTLDLGAIINPSQRSEERSFSGAHVEIHPAFETLTAQGVNSSTGGACFESSTPLRFRVRIPEAGTEIIREAELVWLNHESDGMSRIGFKFVD